MDKEFKQAVADVIRDQIVKKNDIKIPGLGSFRCNHVKQHQKQYENGRVVMVPPRDEIIFVPENNRGV